MEEEERKEILNSLYPVNKERWIKIMVLDRDKCVKSLRFDNPVTHKLGYNVTAIGIRDEFLPQISAMHDLQEEIISLMYQWELKSDMTNQIIGIFKNKIDELKNRTILKPL